MFLRELIGFLAARDPAIVVPLGFRSPHSYRGSYDELAFEPTATTTVGEMLACAKQALGATYTGYKGGEFTMTEWTPCHLARWGDTGEGIGEVLLRYMVGEIATPNVALRGEPLAASPSRKQGSASAGPEKGD